jgi:hypothetical protein
MSVLELYGTQEGYLVIELSSVSFKDLIFSALLIEV